MYPVGREMQPSHTTITTYLWHCVLLLVCHAHLVPLAVQFLPQYHALFPRLASLPHFHLTACWASRRTVLLNSSCQTVMKERREDGTESAFSCQKRTAHKVGPGLTSSMAGTEKQRSTGLCTSRRMATLRLIGRWWSEAFQVSMGAFQAVGYSGAQGAAGATSCQAVGKGGQWWAMMQWWACTHFGGAFARHPGRTGTSLCTTELAHQVCLASPLAATQQGCSNSQPAASDKKES